MSGNKTKPTNASVEAFIAGLADEQMQADCRAVAAMMAEVTGAEPKLWGTTIVGFGSYHYRYASGREGDFMLAGFAPRKRALTLYVMAGFAEYGPLLARLGKHTTGKSCLYIKRLADVDQGVMREITALSVAAIRQKYD